MPLAWSETGFSTGGAKGPSWRGAAAGTLIAAGSRDFAAADTVVAAGSSDLATAGTLVAGLAAADTVVAVGRSDFATAGRLVAGGTRDVAAGGRGMAAG